MTKKKDREKAEKAGKSAKMGPAEQSASGRSLTVSYGAFSCTLEGYENPVEIVSVLSEQFRAIAAAEPRFALAPPPLDLDMLRQIAQAELRRQVEAGVIDAATIIDLARTEPARDARPEPDDAELAEGPADTNAPTQSAAADAQRKSRRAEVIAQLRAAVEQATADHRRAVSRRPGDTATAPKADVTPVQDPPPTPPETVPKWASADPLPPLRLGPDLRLDAGHGVSAAIPAAQLPSAPSAQLRAYGPFAAAPDMDARLLATARYLAEVEGRISFEAAHAVALVHVNAPDANAAHCRAAFDHLVKTGALARLDKGRFALSPIAAKR